MANSRVIGSGLSFDAGNNAVVIADAGTYLFLWHVAGNVPQTSDLLISLESLDGKSGLIDLTFDQDRIARFLPW